jgi:hypothetical protein
MSILTLASLKKRILTSCLFFLLCGLISAEDNQTQWNWHGAFPWVYSHKEQGWHYWHAGTDGKFYRWKDSNQTWYLFDQTLEKWLIVSAIGAADDESKSDSSDKSEYDNWWDNYDKSDDSSKDNSTSSSAETLNLSLQHDGLRREYLLYVPNSYNNNTAVPLLFNFMAMEEQVMVILHPRICVPLQIRRISYCATHRGLPTLMVSVTGMHLFPAEIIRARPMTADSLTQ